MTDMANKWRLQSKWQVTALGEQQQSTGVGAGQPPTHQELQTDGVQGIQTDNALNSIEQEIGLEFWVDRAIDLLNRGKTPDQIIAQFEHAGCPDPEGLVERALKQPRQDFQVNNEMPEQPPMPPQQAAPSDISETAMPQGVQAKTVDYDLLWGQKVSITESIEDSDPYRIIHDVLDGIDQLPVPTDKDATEERISHLKSLRAICRKVLAENQLDIVDEVRIDKLSHNAQLAILDLRGRVGGFEDTRYADSQPKYTFNAFGFEGTEEAIEPELRIDPYDEARLEEDAAIFAAELSPDVDATGAATYHAKAHNIPIEPFVAATKQAFHLLYDTSGILCPKCGQELRDGSLFGRSGTVCPRCGYESQPGSAAEHVQDNQAIDAAKEEQWRDELERFAPRHDRPLSNVKEASVNDGPAEQLFI